MEILLSLSVGVGLSAACGFRVFIPFLIMNLAARSGHAVLSSDFGWIASDAALTTFAIAAMLEISAFYIPWLDNILDTVATPAALIAGSILTASQLSETSPFLQWALAIIVGGGTAGIIQGGTVLVRGTSSAGTGGIANSALSTSELLGSVFTTILAIALPLLMIIFIIFLCYYTIKMAGRLFFRKSLCN